MSGITFEQLKSAALQSAQMAFVQSEDSKVGRQLSVITGHIAAHQAFETQAAIVDALAVKIGANGSRISDTQMKFLQDVANKLSDYSIKNEKDGAYIGFSKDIIGEIVKDTEKFVQESNVGNQQEPVKQEPANNFDNQSEPVKVEKQSEPVKQESVEKQPESGKSVETKQEPAKQEPVEDVESPARSSGTKGVDISKIRRTFSRMANDITDFLWYGGFRDDKFFDPAVQENVDKLRKLRTKLEIIEKSVDKYDSFTVEEKTKEEADFIQMEIDKCKHNLSKVSTEQIFGKGGIDYEMKFDKKIASIESKFEKGLYTESTCPELHKFIHHVKPMLAEYQKHRPDLMPKEHVQCTLDAQLNRAGTYKNLFIELDKLQTEVDTKIEAERKRTSAINEKRAAEIKPIVEKHLAKTDKFEKLFDSVTSRAIEKYKHLDAKSSDFWKKQLAYAFASAKETFVNLFKYSCESEATLRQLPESERIKTAIELENGMKRFYRHVFVNDVKVKVDYYHPSHPEERIITRACVLNDAPKYINGEFKNGNLQGSHDKILSCYGDNLGDLHFLGNDWEECDKHSSNRRELYHQKHPDAPFAIKMDVANDFLALLTELLPDYADKKDIRALGAYV